MVRRAIVLFEESWSVTQKLQASRHVIPGAFFEEDVKEPEHYTRTGECAELSTSTPIHRVMCVPGEAEKVMCRGLGRLLLGETQVRPSPSSTGGTWMPSAPRRVQIW